MTATWDVVHSGPLSVALTGPGIDRENRHVADAIADFSDPEDDRHGPWDAYVTARRNLANAGDVLTDGEPALEALRKDVEIAWDRLSPELPASVRMAFKEARLVAGLLDDRAGRIGVIV
jgi:hypothetical protein